MRHDQGRFYLAERALDDIAGSLPRKFPNFFSQRGSRTRASPLSDIKGDGTPVDVVLCCFQKSRLVALAEKSKVGQQGMKRAVRTQ